jgi:hypothetical protein
VLNDLFARFDKLAAVSTPQQMHQTVWLNCYNSTMQFKCRLCNFLLFIVHDVYLLLMIYLIAGQ